MHAKTQPQDGLIEECLSDSGYTAHFDAACAEAIADNNICTCCNRRGLVYYGFKGYGTFRAISKCPNCGDEQDF